MATTTTAVSQAPPTPERKGEKRRKEGKKKVVTKLFKYFKNLIIKCFYCHHFISISLNIISQILREQTPIKINAKANTINSAYPRHRKKGGG